MFEWKAEEKRSCLRKNWKSLNQKRKETSAEVVTASERRWSGNKAAKFLQKHPETSTTRPTRRWKHFFSELLSFVAKWNRNPSSASKLTKDTTAIRTIWGRSLWLLDRDLQLRHRELQPAATLHHVCRADAAWLRGEICVWWISCGFHLCCRLSSSALELKRPAPKTTVQTEGWCRNSWAERQTLRWFQFVIRVAETETKRFFS